MADNSSYQVKNPDILYMLCMGVVCICVAVAAVFALATPDLHIGLVWFMVAVLIVPFAVGALWAKRYCITVKGRTLIVQKSFRLKPCHLDISDITKAVYVVSNTRGGINVKLTVHTDICGKFTIETLMSNANRLQEQIKQSIGKDKIKVIHKSFVE